MCIKIVNKVDIASQVMAIVTFVVAMGGIYYYITIIICINIITRSLDECIYVIKGMCMYECI